MAAAEAPHQSRSDLFSLHPPCACCSTTRGGSTKPTERIERGGSLVRRAAAPAASKQQRAQKPRSDPDQQYVNVTGYPFPLGPFLNRPTIRKELVKGAIWGFEQPQSLGGSNVTANIRMTVVRLQSGGLWVHAPIAPTREQGHCLPSPANTG